MPEFRALLGQCRDDVRMTMSDSSDGDPGAEIKETGTFGCCQPSAFSSLKGDRKPVVGGQNG